MAYEREHRSDVPPESWRNEDEHRRKLAQSVRGLLRGESNNHFTVTLEAGASETEIPYQSSRAGVSPVLTPLSEAGSAFLRTKTLWCEAQPGKVVVHHDPSATGEERFSLVIVG